jgi:hypothetical protein
MIAVTPKKGETLEPLVLSMRFTGHVTGEPPEVEVHGEAETVTVEGGDGGGIDFVSYDTHVTFTSETSFTESGRVSVGRNGDALLISTVGRATSGRRPISPSCTVPWFGGSTGARERWRARAAS